MVLVHDRKPEVEVEAGEGTFPCVAPGHEPSLGRRRTG